MKILALDLGKSNSVGCLFETVDQRQSFVTVRTTPGDLHDLLVSRGPDRVVFEIGTSAGWVYDLAVSLGLQVQVANPNHEGWRWRNVKKKTDRADALKLARLSAAEQLPQVHMPSRAVREMRALVGYRHQLVRRRTAIKNGIRSLMQRQGLAMQGTSAAWSVEGLSYLRSLGQAWEGLEAEELWRLQLQEELKALEVLQAQIGRVEAKLDALGEKNESVGLLRTIPGVGPRTAEAMVAVLDDPHRFGSRKEVGSYVGLTPRRYQSGSMDRSGRISKQGNALLRKLLVEVSWLALRYNPHLRQLYQRILRGSRSRRKIAIVAVARRLLVWSWAMLRDRQVWKSPPAAEAA